MSDMITDTSPADTGAQPGTRERILDAARELVLERHPAALTVAQIAATAGMSQRTVYRYFPTKEELFAAVASRPTDRIPGLVMPTRWAEARGALRVYWQLFGGDLDMLRSERMIPGGLELRRARLADARVGFDRLLADAGVPAATRANLVEIVIHLTSSSTLLELVDRHGMTVDEASDVVLDALDLIVAAARARD
jgi:AcrR family transcriptional regulator